MAHKGNMTEALESELAGLEARLAAAGGDDAPESVKATLTRRIGEVKAQLDPKAKAAAEKRPARSTAEKRPA